MSETPNLEDQTETAWQLFNNLYHDIASIQSIFLEKSNVFEIETESGFLKNIDYNFWGLINISTFNEQIKENIDDNKTSLALLKKIVDEGDSNLYTLIDLKKTNKLLSKQLTVFCNLNQIFTECYNKLLSFKSNFSNEDVLLILRNNKNNQRDNFINYFKEIESFKIQVDHLLLPLCIDLKNQVENAFFISNKLKSAINNENRNQAIKYNKAIEEINLIAQNFESTINLLTEKFDNRYKNFVQETEKVKQSSDLLSKNVDNGIKNTIDLNKRIQQMEIDFSKIIKNKNEEITLELEGEKSILLAHLQEIKESLAAEQQRITSAHKSFIKTVENAGIYNLTQNYDNKAKEEKTEYQTFRKYTSRSLYAAILCTIIILGIPLVEYWAANPPVNTNYYTILSRLTISLMFFVLALYFSKQAAKHYECYQENHKTFLQLAALEPFMANMLPEDQLSIRKQLIPTYFNQNADGKFAPKSEEIGLPSSLNTPIEKLIELLKPVIDKASDKDINSSK